MMINETQQMIVILTTNMFAVIEKVLLNVCNLKCLQSFQIMQNGREMKEQKFNHPRTGKKSVKNHELFR